jgi:imidazole glycerol-phosphate synthase subunit HisF
MLIPRVIPSLLLDDDTFVKTVRYADPTYVGDPVNVINIFNRFEVDEIVLLDISATPRQRKPSFQLIEELAAECWVPLTYGGGITELEDVRRILGSGVEKVVLNTIVADDPGLVTRVADVFGSQAVVVSVDARRVGPGRHEVFVAGGTRSLGIDPITSARRAEALGAGEILLNSIDRDGTMEGYDTDLVRTVAVQVGIPVIACGGAGERRHLVDPIRAGASAVAAGSIFVYRGPTRGVLVNFPERAQLEAMLR